MAFHGAGSLLLGDMIGATDTSLGEVTMSGSSAAYLESGANYGIGVFPAMTGNGIGGDVAAGFGMGSGEFPAMVGIGEEYAYLPPEPEYGYSIFPAMTGAGFLVSSHPGDGNSTFPEMIGHGYDSESMEYGAGYSTFPEMTGIGTGDLTPGYAFILERVLAFDGLRPDLSMILVINENMEVTGTITADRILIEQFLIGLEATGDLTVIGTYLGDALETMLASFSITGQLLTSVRDEQVAVPALDSSCRVWVVNLGTGAATQYDGYGFRSFFEHGDKYYGVAEDGIYELDGDNDAGLPIDALINFGNSDLGSKQRKGITGVYVGASSDGKLLLRVSVDGGQSYTYRARSYSQTLDRHRFDTGKGLVGNYHTLELLNEDGDDFDIESIHFEPIPIRRKI